MPLEIERKWELSSVPPIFLTAGEQHMAICQQYLPVGEAGEVRIRRINREATDEITYCITFKSDGDILRREHEEEITQRVYDFLTLVASSGTIITKNIVSLPHEGLLLELHMYVGDQNNLEGLLILECEFIDVETADAFELPIFIEEAGAVEVTNDQRYKNKNLARHGRPNPDISS